MPSASVLHARKYFEENAPGVYLEDKFNLPRTRAFTTGVPVFIGFVKFPPKPKDKDVEKGSERARLGAERAERQRHGPQMLSLWSQFSAHVGEPDQECMLAYAVRGFFQNGGERCYVIVLEDERTESLWNALDMAGAFRTIDLVCLPDTLKSREETFERQQLVVKHCESAGDRFAILDS